MNLNEEKYTKFGLVKDMLATPDIVAKLDCNRMASTAQAIKALGRRRTLACVRWAIT